MYQNKYFAPTAIIGACLMMILRFLDKAGPFSVLLVTAGLTALVYSLRHARRRTEYIMIAIFMALAYTIRFYGYTGSPATDLILGPIIGLIMFGLMNTETLAGKYRDHIRYTLIFPLSFLLFLYLTEIVKINMPFRLDTYLSCFTLLCQITAAFGIYFLDFLLAWTASVLVFLLDHKISKKSMLSALFYTVSLCGILCFCIAHKNQMDQREKEKTDTLRVAYVTGPYVGTLSDDSYMTFTMEENMISFTKAVSDAAAKQAQILLFSEEAYNIPDINEDTFLEKAEEMAVANDMHLLLAYEVADTDQSEDGRSINKLCWISADGEILCDYTKHCLVPIVETSEYVQGKEPIKAFDINVDGRNLKVAAAICYDSDFDLFMAHMGKNVDLLLLPTWDWDVIAEEHFGVARLRAISNETTLVRSVYDGWSAVIDSSGDILKRDNTNDIGYGTVQFYDVPVNFH